MAIKVTPTPHLSLLMALMPQGLAWPREIDPLGDSHPLLAVLSAWAAELERVDARINTLLEEANPAWANELAADWMALLELPPPGDASYATGTLQEWRTAILTRLGERGGQSWQYFQELATALGYTITIVAHQPFQTTSGVDRRIEPWEAIFFWEVFLTVANKQMMTAQSSVNAPLQVWGNEARLVATLTEDAPAHTVVNILYQ